MSDSDSDVEFVPVTRAPRGGTARRRGIGRSARSRRSAVAPPSPAHSDKTDEDFVPVVRSPRRGRRGVGRPARGRRSAVTPSPVHSDKLPDSDVEPVNSDSDADAAPVVAPPKRRRMIDPSAIKAVPIYSNKVFSCLNLNKMPAATLVKSDATAAGAKCPDEAALPLPSSQTDVLTDSEDEHSTPQKPQKPTVQPVNTVIRSPSPPPPLGSPTMRSLRSSGRKVSEMKKKLNVLGSRLRTSPLKRSRRRSGSTPSTPTAGHAHLLQDEDEDEGDRDVTLKFRCRTTLHKVTVSSSAPLSKAVEELSVKIKVPPSRLLLLMKETELPTDSTANELGLSIADIIDCVIIEEENKEADENDDGIISIRIQNKERSAAQTYSLHRDAALGSVLSQYLSSTYANAKRRPKVVFCFDGTTIKHSQTPSQLDMEDGDVIDVWA